MCVFGWCDSNTYCHQREWNALYCNNIITSQSTTNNIAAQSECVACVPLETEGPSLVAKGQFQGPEIPIGSLLSLIGWEILINEMYLDFSWWIHSAAKLNPQHLLLAWNPTVWCDRQRGQQPIIFSCASIRTTLESKTMFSHPLKII